MREITTKNIEVGEHIIIDEIEYVAEEAIGKRCYLCAFHNSNKCENIPCSGVIFERVNKEPQYRPYKDTEEMITDYKERFNVSNVPAISMPFIWVQKRRLTSLITEYFNDSVSVNGMMCSMGALLLEYTYLDGSPCGKVEE